MAPTEPCLINPEKLCDARIACPTGMNLDRAFYRAISKSQHILAKYGTICSDGVVYLLSPKRKSFAVLDVQATKALWSLKEKLPVHFEAAILSVDRDTPQAQSQNSAETCDVSINIYGDPKLAGQVGDILADVGKYLQHPFLLDFGMDYSNPHYFIAPGSSIDLNSLVKHRLNGSNSERNLSMEVSKLLDSLNFIGTDHELPRNEGIKTLLLRLVTTYRI